MDLLALAGFRAVRITQVWAPGERTLSAEDKTVLANVAAAAKLSNVTVAHERPEPGQQDDPAHRRATSPTSPPTPRTSCSRCPSLRILIVGNEPNLNRYWLPQFNADGTDAAAPAYESLLATTYDAVKAVGAARHRARRRGLAARRRRRRRDPADALADGLHPGHGPGVPRERPHDADHGRLRVPPVRGQLERRASGRHRTRTRRRSRSPTTTSSSRCSARRSATTRCRSGTTSSASSRRSRRRSRACTRTPSRRRRSRCPRRRRRRTTGRRCSSRSASRTSAGSSSSTRSTSATSTGWQSGLYYADDTPKSSLAAVRTRARPGAPRHRSRTAPAWSSPSMPKVVQRGAVLTLTCDLDCSYVAAALPAAGPAARHEARPCRRRQARRRCRSRVPKLNGVVPPATLGARARESGRLRRRSA